ncbi:MAG TPA: saccharopine dehydrogenase NADP-binding domain-containing protein [Steroidobacteraceae bacterium]
MAAIRIETAEFPGRVLMVGCGSIGQAALPLLRRHLTLPEDGLTVLEASEQGRALAAAHQARFVHCHLKPATYERELKRRLRPGDLLLNLSVDVSSLDLVEWCSAHGVLYVDTSIEPWPGVFDNPMLPLRERTNYLTREDMLKLARRLKPGAPTAVVDHGANPGLVSHFVKQGLLDLASGLGRAVETPAAAGGWAALARDLGVTLVQISERDTQATDRPKRPNEFVNTWSIDGFVDELMQPSELSLGTAEPGKPPGSYWHRPRCGSVYLHRPGGATFARSWLPSSGGYQGLLMTHDEVFSIADHLTLRQGAKIEYRPTVMFVYHPCDDAMLSALELEGRGWMPQPVRRIIRAEIVTGMDELGVLIAGHAKNAYWFGSQLSISEARRHVPYTNATCLQVAAGALGATIWAIRHPREGLREADDLDFREVIEIARPYLGSLVGAYTDWTPLQGRGELFSEKLVPEQPWLLQNVRARQWR